MTVISLENICPICKCELRLTILSGNINKTYKYLSCERDANAFSSIIIILLWSRYLEEGKEIHEHEIISYLFMLCVFSAKQKATVIIGLWKSLWLVIAARALNKVKLLVLRLIYFKNESQHVGCILHITFFSDEKGWQCAIETLWSTSHGKRLKFTT